MKHKNTTTKKREQSEINEGNEEELANKQKERKKEKERMKISCAKRKGNVGVDLPAQPDTMAALEERSNPCKALAEATRASLTPSSSPCGL